jgi:adenylylsulfate kinase-like enzyme
MIIWFKGISGVGKSTLGSYFYKIKKKKIKNLVYVDGDIFRKLFKNDLGYTLKDRNTNASRLCTFVKLLQSQKINIIVTANLTSKKYQNLSKKIYHNYLSIFIESKLSNLKIRDKKKVYKNKKNIVGLNIKYDKPKNSDLHIRNDSTKKKFLENIKLIEKLIKKKKLIYD